MKQYLTFRSESMKFGLESSHIREIFPLPELQSIAEAPGDVIGLLNLRGHIIPAIHLGKRLGMSQPVCRVSDSMILMEWQGLQIGLVINQVEDIQEIAEAAVVAAIDFERQQYMNTALIHGFAQLEDELLTLLHPESLIRQADEVAILAWDAKLSQESEAAQDLPLDESDSLHHDFYDFCNGITEANRLIFARRAQELLRPLESFDLSERQPVTIMSIEGEYFGVGLENIREFINVPNLTRIPCAPQYIIGNFNLRGEIMTLLDVSASLDLDYPQSSRRPKAVILEVDRQRIGISVDEVHDVLYLAQEDYLEFPATISPTQHGVLLGAFDYQGSVIRLINLPKLVNMSLPKTVMTSDQSSTITV